MPTVRPRLGRALAVIAVVAAPAAAPAQITFAPTYADGDIRAGGVGFADPTVDTGETLSRGALRRNSLTAAFDYLNTVLDGRGTVALAIDPSQNSPSSGFLAFFGPSQLTSLNGVGSFQNGGVYQAARTNQRPFATAPAGSGAFNFGFGYNYAGQATPINQNNFDLTTIAIHEVTHGAGFLSLTRPDGGSDVSGGGVGIPRAYSGYDRFLQRGTGPGATRLFDTSLASPNFGAFVGDASTFTNGNDPATGLFFGGPFAQEVAGGPVGLFAPAGYQDGSSVSHLSAAAPVMNPAIAPNVVKRFQPVEVAILMDIGWNVYNWNGSTTGTWAAGAPAGGPLDVAASNWRTDVGIVFNGAANGNQRFNIRDNPNTGADESGQAPVLPPYAQVTSNIALNFAGGTTPYTATNDIGTVRLARLNLAAQAAVTNTVAGQPLLFGRNSDGTASVLAPKVVQQGIGAFDVTAPVQIPNGLTVDGPVGGTGRVTLAGVVSGDGRLTKGAGDFALALTGANTYAGGTTVTAGVLLVNGQTGADSGTGPGAVTAAGGTVGGTGRVAGPLTVTAAVVAPGEVAAPGVLTAGGGVTLGAGSILAVELNGPTAGAGYDQLVVQAGDVALGGATLTRAVAGYTPGADDRLVIIRNDGPGGLSGEFNMLPNGTSFDVGGRTAYIYYGYDATFNLFSGGNDVAITFTAAPVPEPAAVLAAAAAGLGLAGRARRPRTPPTPAPSC